MCLGFPALHSCFPSAEGREDEDVAKAYSCGKAGGVLRLEPLKSRGHLQH